MPSMKVVSEEPRRCPVKSRFTAIVFSLFLLRELIGIGFTFCSLRITKAMRASARKAGNDCDSALRFFAKYSLAKKQQVTSVCPHACRRKSLSCQKLKREEDIDHSNVKTECCAERCHSSVATTQ